MMDSGKGRAPDLRRSRVGTKPTRPRTSAIVTPARTSAKRIPGMAADLGIGDSSVNGCGRYSEYLISLCRPGQVQRLLRPFRADPAVRHLIRECSADRLGP